MSAGKRERRTLDMGIKVEGSCFSYVNLGVSTGCPPPPYGLGRGVQLQFPATRTESIPTAYRNESKPCIEANSPMSSVTLKTICNVLKWVMAANKHISVLGLTSYSAGGGGEKGAIPIVYHNTELMRGHGVIFSPSLYSSLDSLMRLTRLLFIWHEDLSLRNYWEKLFFFLLHCIVFSFTEMTADGFLFAGGFANLYSRTITALT